MEKNKELFIELSRQLGGFGKYQVYIFVLGSIAACFGAMPLFNFIIVGKTLDHRCFIPECELIDNTTYQSNFLNFTTPVKESNDSWAECYRFKTIDTRDESCDSLNFNEHIQINCSEYVYDTSVLRTTTASEYDLVCEYSWLKSLSSSIHMFGIMFGAILIGEISDRFGRKKVILLGLLLTCVGELLGAFTSGIAIYLIGRVISGVGLVALLSGPFVLVLEFVPMEKRNFCGNLIWVPFAFGGAFIAVLSYFFRDWRTLQIATTVPLFLLFPYFWLLPESIRWLISRGRFKEAKTIINKIEKFNNVKVSESLMDKLLSSTENINDDNESKRSPLDLVRYPNMRKRILILIYCWNVSTLVYYGLGLNSVELGGDLFVNFAAVMLVEAPSYLIAYAMLDRIGRKWSMSVTFFIGGFGCLLSTAFSKEFEITIVVLNMIGKFGISAAFSIVYIYTVEIFPTTIRSLALGSCSTAARIGSIVAPFIADLSNILEILPLLIYGATGIIAAIVILLLPETLGCEMPQTVEESENFGKDQRILDFPCLSKKGKLDIKPETNHAFSDT